MGTEPLEREPCAQERPPAFPPPPYTVDTLFELPHYPQSRCEVLEGALVVTPAPTPTHNLAADRLRAVFMAAVPATLEAITAVATLVGRRT